MFTADVVPFAMGTGMGYYSVYNLTVLSAEKGTFQDWQPTLNKVLSSLNYTPEFQSFAMSQSNQAASTSQALSQSASEMSDSIMRQAAPRAPRARRPSGTPGCGPAGPAGSP